MEGSAGLPIADREPGPDVPARAPTQITITNQVAALIVIVTPILGVVAAPFAVWGWGFYWSDLILLVGFYLPTSLGITVGFHRLFVHRSFETNIVVKFLFAVFGSMALQGPLLEWVALHRRHHQFSDQPGDPHSPHLHDGSLLGVLRGFWHSHLGWIFDTGPIDLDRYVTDLNQSRVLRWVSDQFVLWGVLSMLLPAALGGLMTGTWAGALTGMIWGGMVRIFLFHHVTWAINSACHLWGARPYRCNDESRNNVVFGVVGWGEGWHNNHHAFPSSARHGLQWWQLDVSYGVIWTLSRLGLAWDVKLPTKQARLRRQDAN
jgi:stearoyl-CoA desaturase (delta-9 desaturase)